MLQGWRDCAFVSFIIRWLQCSFVATARWIATFVVIGQYVRDCLLLLSCALGVTHQLHLALVLTFLAYTHAKQLINGVSVYLTLRVGLLTN